MRIGVWTHKHLLKRFLGGPNTCSQGMTGGFWKTRVTVYLSPCCLPFPIPPSPWGFAVRTERVGLPQDPWRQGGRDANFFARFQRLVAPKTASFLNKDPGLVARKSTLKVNIIWSQCTTIHFLPIIRKKNRSFRRSPSKFFSVCRHCGLW